MQTSKWILLIVDFNVILWYYPQQLPPFSFDAMEMEPEEKETGQYPIILTFNQNSKMNHFTIWRTSMWLPHILCQPFLIFCCNLNFLVRNKFGVNSVRINYRFTPYVYQNLLVFLKIDSFHIFISSFDIVMKKCRMHHVVKRSLIAPCLKIVSPIFLLVC